MQKYKLIIPGLQLLLLSACISVLNDAQKVTIRCDASSELEYEIIQCYKQENAKILSRKVKQSVHGLTAGDWPFEFQFVFEAHLSSIGKVKQIDVLEESSSYRLNKMVTKTIKSISEFYVPHNALFVKGGFEHLKILIVPARTPILSDEVFNDHGAIVIYLIETCSLRSERC